MKKSKQDKAAMFELDLSRLEEHWVEQPKLVYRYLKELAQAKADLDAAKSNLDLVSAELDHDIRASPEDYHINKVSESSIKNTILMQDEYKEADEEVRQAKYQVDMLSALTSALEHRKRALEGLVQLHGQQYFASPNVSGSDMGEVAKRSTRNKGRSTT